jgi:hypothetical protein
MAEIIWTPSGGLDISGCANAFHVDTIPLTFGVGDIAFLRSQALKGVLERITIKRVGARTDINHNCGDPLINYIDSFNAHYMANELVTHAEAIALATAYLERQIALTEELEICK